MPANTTETRKNSRTKNVLSNWAGYIIATVINFVLAPFVVHNLGDTAYGIWVLLGSLVGYLGLLDLGVRGAVTRYISKFHALDEHSEAAELASSALVVFLFLGLVATALATVLAMYVVQIFEVPSDLAAATRIVVVLGGLNIAVSIVSGVFGGIVIGLQRFDYINIAEVAIGIFRALAVVLALKAGMGLVALAVIQLGMSGLRGLANFWLSRRVYPEIRVRLSDCRRSKTSLIFSFSLSVVLLQASGMLIMFSDSIVIGACLPVSMVTFFAIAANLTEYARAPISGISHTLSPWASALQANSEVDELQQGLLGAARLATIVILPIVFTFMLRGSSFISLWMGPEYADISGTVLWILSLSLWFAVANQTVTATLMGVSKHGKLVPIFVLEAIVNIALSVTLAKTYGVVGVAWGTTIPRLVVSLCFAPWYVRRVFSIPIARFWFTVWLKPTFAMLPFGLMSFYIEHTWSADNLFFYFGQVAATLPIAAAGIWLVCLTPPEKLRVKIAALTLLRRPQNDSTS